MPIHPLGAARSGLSPPLPRAAFLFLACRDGAKVCGVITLLDDPVRSTWIFGALLVVALLAGARRRAASGEIFPRSATDELKGFAILAVFFAHVGYFLVDDGRFLFPLSVGGGLGVNLFLTLAGYGLAASALARPRSAIVFYCRHLPKLYVPAWATLAIFFALDYLILGRSYGPGYLGRSFLGYFPTADIAADVNSPLWFFTLILGSYLLFPLLFSARRPWVTALAYAALGAAAANLPALAAVGHLYESHYLAFPVGILVASLLASDAPIARSLIALRDGRAGLWAAAAAAAAVAWVSVYASGVGTDHEQLIGFALALLAAAAFLLKPWRFRIFGIFGALSYEIYLLHWPLLSRYGSPYDILPGWLATFVSLALLLALGALLRKIVGRKTTP